MKTKPETVLNLAEKVRDELTVTFCTECGDYDVIDLGCEDPNCLVWKCLGLCTDDVNILPV